MAEILEKFVLRDEWSLKEAAEKFEYQIEFQAHKTEDHVKDSLLQIMQQYKLPEIERTKLWWKIENKYQPVIMPEFYEFVSEQKNADKVFEQELKGAAGDSDKEKEIGHNAAKQFLEGVCTS